MDIKSLEYPLFIAGFLLVFFLLQRTRLQKWWILAADLYFLQSVTGMASVPVCAGLIAIVWCCGLGIQKGTISKKEHTSAAKACYWCGLAADLGILLYYKFFTQAGAALFQKIGSGEAGGMVVLAPLGLSYYVLSLAGYLYDVWNAKYPAEKNYVSLLSFALYFPAIIQGPFNLYKDLTPQLTDQHTYSRERTVMGLQRTLWGYFKKVVIADRIGILVAGILADEAADGGLLYLCMILYSFQIYTDFSGGIDVIMGISECMGIMLPENFRQPLAAVSVTEFWQRWHMSLGGIMEKYVYYPIVLGKKTRAVSKKIRNKYLSRVFAASLGSFVVFVLVGIWHGTGWNYVVYGLYQALFTTSAVLLAGFYKECREKLHIRDGKALHLFRVLRTFAILVFGRYFTRAGTLTKALYLLKKTFTGEWTVKVFTDGTLTQYGLDIPNLVLMLILIALIIVVDILHEKGIHFRTALMQKPFPARLAVYYLGLFGIIILGIYGGQYTGASFIYAQF